MLNMIRPTLSTLPLHGTLPAALAAGKVQAAQPNKTALRVVFYRAACNADAV